MNNTRLFSRALLGLALICMMATTALAQSNDVDKAIELTKEEMKEYVGQYDPEDGQFFSVTVSMQDDKLMAQPTDKRQPLTQMAAIAKDKFNLVGPPISFTFNRNDEGKIISLTFAQGGRSFTAKKKEE